MLQLRRCLDGRRSADPYRAFLLSDPSDLPEPFPQRKDARHVAALRLARPRPGEEAPDVAGAKAARAVL